MEYSTGRYDAKFHSDNNRRPQQMLTDSEKISDTDGIQLAENKT